MIKRTAKTDEQLYIDWASKDPEWLVNTPLNKANLEAYKKTFDFAILKMNDAFGCLWDAIISQPEWQALKKHIDKLGKTQTPKPITKKVDKVTYEKLRECFKDQDFKRSMDSGANDESVGEAVSAFAQQMSEDMPAAKSYDLKIEFDKEK